MREGCNLLLSEADGLPVSTTARAPSPQGRSPKKIATIQFCRFPRRRGRRRHKAAVPRKLRRFSSAGFHDGEGAVATRPQSQENCDDSVLPVSTTARAPSPQGRSPKKIATIQFCRFPRRRGRRRHKAAVPRKLRRFSSASFHDGEGAVATTGGTQFIASASTRHRQRSRQARPSRAMHDGAIATFSRRLDVDVT